MERVGIHQRDQRTDHAAAVVAGIAQHEKKRRNHCDCRHPGASRETSLSSSYRHAPEKDDRYTQKWFQEGPGSVDERDIHRGRHADPAVEAREVAEVPTHAAKDRVGSYQANRKVDERQSTTEGISGWFRPCRRRGSSLAGQSVFVPAMVRDAKGSIAK